MAFAKKGCRRITVNNVLYRWVLCPDDDPGIAIVVQRARSPGRRMVTWVGYYDLVTPWLVRLVILRALAGGWDPGERGPQVVFRLEGTFSRGDYIPFRRIQLLVGP